MTLKVVRFLFRLYHLFFPNQLVTCRFTPTCSQYALEAITKHGFIQGLVLTLKRVVSCHPFSKRPYYDPA